MTIILIVLHFLIVLVSSTQLPAEFTLYPYLNSQGFLPYLEIIDNHLPFLLHGPLSLPASLVTNSDQLRALFLTITTLTDIFLYLALIYSKKTVPRFFLLVWVGFSLWLGLSNFWYEQFVLLFMSAIFILLVSKRPLSMLAIGVLSSLILLCRPQVFIGLILLFHYKKISLDRHFFTGFLTPLVLLAYYLQRNNLIFEFYQQVIKFNLQNYLVHIQPPTIIQLAMVVVTISFFWFLNHRNLQRVSIVIVCFLTALSVFPRFELNMLLPALLILIFLSADSRFGYKTLTLGSMFSTLLIVTYAAKIIVFPPTIDNASRKLLQEQLTKQKSAFATILGPDRDLLASTNKIPPGYFYLSQQNWYLTEPTLIGRQLAYLQLSPAAPIYLHQSFPSKTIRNYLLSTHKQIGQAGLYDIYTSK